MILAIMQPYLFPYWGYFQLIHAADKFIFYDDVNYIKGGWINRNNILVNGRKHMYTVEVTGASSFKKINEIQLGRNMGKVLKTIEQAYNKAPYFQQAFPIVKRVFSNKNPEQSIAQLAIHSVTEVCTYLEIDTILETSSERYPYTRDSKGTKRLFKICKENLSHLYINTLAGSPIYSKKEFSEQNIELRFLDSLQFEYLQFVRDFTPHLSIIDVLMFNSRDKLQETLPDYSFQ